MKKSRHVLEAIEEELTKGSYEAIDLDFVKEALYISKRHLLDKDDQQLTQGLTKLIEARVKVGSHVL
jgi:hypothetical protein